MIMQKALLTAIAAFAIATVAQATEYVLPHGATPYQPAGTIAATMPGSIASLGYLIGEFTPVSDLTQAAGTSVDDEGEAAPHGTRR